MGEPLGDIKVIVIIKMFHTASFWPLPAESGTWFPLLFKPLPSLVHQYVDYLFLPLPMIVLFQYEQKKELLWSIFICQNIIYSMEVFC